MNLVSLYFENDCRVDINTEPLQGIMTLLFRMHTIFLLTLLATLIACFTSCDTTFEPMQENNQYHFSVYGYLDVSADTQWVRVTPIRDQLRPTGEPLDATVTLENLSSGETMVMNDSLIQILGETVPVAWTTEKIEPDTPYRFRVESDTKSLAETHTPNLIPPLLVDVSADPSTRPHSFFTDGIETLVDARAIYCVREHGDSEQEFVIFSIPVTEYRELTTEGFPSRYRIELRGIESYLSERVVINHSEESLGERYQFFPRQVRVYTSNEYWPDFISLDRFEQELPEGAVSNVEDGVGFLGSVTSSTARFEMCYDENGNWVACEPEKPITSPLDCLDGGEFDPPN